MRDFHNFLPNANSHLTINKFSAALALSKQIFMKRNFILCTFSFISLLSNSCHKNACCGVADDGTWTALAKFGFIPRSEAISFVIGDSAYLGFGVDANFTRYNDLLVFDPATGMCAQRASCPGSPRNSAVAFSINGEGYVTTGYDGYNMLSDTWQYDPSSNTWTQKASFTGSARFDAVAFSVGNYGWVGTGYDGAYRNDFFKYDPAADTWTPETACPGQPRTQAISFVYNDSAYLVTGNMSASVVNDFWRFDPNLTGALKWRQLRNISNSSSQTFDDGYTTIERSNGVGFVQLNAKSNGGGDRAYITTGLNGALYSWTWSYNFADDLWTEATPLPGLAIEGAVGFSVENKGIVATGISGSTPVTSIYEFNAD
jgi:N-acetylneuraminic acid mutarotase